MYTFSPLQSVFYSVAQVAFSENTWEKVCLIRINSFLYDSTLRTFPLLLSVVNLWERPLWFPKLTWLWALHFLFWDTLINISTNTRVSWSAIRVIILISPQACPYSLTTSHFSAFFFFFSNLLSSLLAHTPHTHWHPPPFCRLYLGMTSTGMLPPVALRESLSTLYIVLRHRSLL